MSRFTPATEAALIKAGWFEGRTVPDETMKDWLVINWCPHPDAPRGYLKISPQAWRVLNEFGGLSIARGTDGTTDFEMNPLLVPDKNSIGHRWDTIAWETGTDLFPLGLIKLNVEEAAYSFSPYRPVFVGNDGRVFIQHHPNHFLGHSIEAALERIVAGDLGEPFAPPDEAESKRITGINDTINDLIQRREKQLMQGQWPDQATTLRTDKNGDYAELLAITDWDAEANLIRRAFGIKVPCVFVGPLKGKTLRPASNPLIFQPARLPLEDDLFLSVYYSSTRMFTILSATPKRLGSAEIGWDGHSDASRGREGATPPVFAKGLFNLGLLTPEIEERLGITPTQHEKLEWQLEFEATP